MKDIVYFCWVSQQHHVVRIISFFSILIPGNALGANSSDEYSISKRKKIKFFNFSSFKKNIFFITKTRLFIIMNSLLFFRDLGLRLVLITHVEGSCLIFQKNKLIKFPVFFFFFSTRNQEKCDYVLLRVEFDGSLRDDDH